MEGERASAVCATRAGTGGGDPQAGGLRAAPHREGAARRRGSLHRHDQRAGQCGRDPAPPRSGPCGRGPAGNPRRQKNGLRELRSILDVLRQVDGGQPAVPLPDRDAFQALADAATAAGIVTRLRCDADLAATPAETALGAYRIVQESLTNVIRHAPDSTADVTISGRDGLLVIDVVNDGPRSQASFVDGAGTGLAGMEERVLVLGGQMRAGRLATGGFRVHAELPTSALESDVDPAPAPEVLTS